MPTPSSPGFILIFVGKILSLNKCISSAEYESVCNGNSFPGNRAAPGRSGCLKQSEWVYREEGSSASMTVQLHLHGRHRVLSVLWVMSHFVYEMTHSAVQIPGVNTKRRNQHPGLLWLIMTSCAWLRAFKRPPEFFYRATLICTWPFYQHLLSVNIKPGEYTGLTAWGIAIWTHIH